MQKIFTKLNSNIFFLLPVFAVLFLIGRFFISPDALNRLEAIPSFYLSSDSTLGNSAAGTLITALSSSGFTLGSSALVNSIGTAANSTSYTYTSDGSTNTPYTKPFGIAVSGNYMYTSHNGDDSVSVYDISTTDSPQYLASFSTSCAIGGILVASSTLYVTNYTSNNFRVYDLTASSTSPTFIRTVTTGTYPIGIAKSAANYIYVANNGGNTISIFDTSSSTNPTLSATYALPSNSPTGIAINGSYLYVGHYDQTIFRVLNITSPTVPTNVTTLATGANPMGLAVYNNVLLVSDYGANTIHQYNVTTASTPVASGNASFSSGGTSPAGIAFSSDGKEMYEANNGSDTFTAYNMGKEKYVSWDWKCGTTPGCYVQTYTGTGVAHAITHSLGAVPAYMIIKRTDTTASWAVYHKSAGNTGYLTLNSTAAFTTDATVWNNTTPTSANFTVGTNAMVNASGGTYVAYIFAEKPGFSKFGSYVGNGVASGPFVNTGFKPKYLLIKSSAAESWILEDSVRSTVNPSSNYVAVDLSNAEAATTLRDLLSNGFKPRSTAQNTNAVTYYYASFADYPFEYASTNNGVTVASSTRFNGTNGYLTRTPGVAGSRTNVTISAWFKRGALSTTPEIMGYSNGVTQSWDLYFNSSDQLVFSDYNSGYNAQLVTTNVYRDPAAWYHLVAQIDTTQAFPDNRIRLYINGTQVTSFSTKTMPALNTSLIINGATPFGIATEGQQLGSYFNGNLADIYFIDGQSLTPTSFGQADTNGRWSPKTYSGTYGTNGFRLSFASAASPGTDSSGNGNNFTATNVATTDNVSDSPTNNYATLNSVNINSSLLLSSGNLVAANNALVNWVTAPASVGVSSGKWYWEFTAGATGGANYMPGITPPEFASTVQANFPGSSATSYGYYGNTGQVYNNGVGAAYGATYTAGDVIGVALDMDTGTLKFYKNNTLQGTAVSGLSGTYVPSFGFYNSSAGTVNFGQGGQAGLTYDSTSGGYFKYTAPAGYKALSAVNMISAATTNASLAKSSNYFNSVIYTGNGSTQVVSTLSFQPDFIWIKDRSSALSHVLYGDTTTITSAVATFFQWFEY